MDSSREFLKKEGIIPYISFKDTGKHRIKLLSDEEDTMIDRETKEKKKGISYTIEENGEKKKFFTSSISLISKLANYDVNSIVDIEMKKRKTEDGSWQSYFEVSEVDVSADQSSEVKTEDIV